MNEERKSIIQKTIIDLQYSGTEDAFAFQKKVTDWSGKQMIETLEETLNRINIPGAAVKIDRMELDIVLDEKGNWLEQLAINVSEQLRKQLEERMSVSSGSETGTTKLSSHENFFEAFVYFLRQGILPWWYTIKEQRSFFEELNILLDQGFSGHIKTVMKELVSRENVQQRITWQLPEKTFYQLIQEISFAELPNLEPLVTSVEKIAEALSTEEKKEVNRLLRKIILQQVGETDSGISEKVIVEKFIQAIAGKRLVAIFAEQADRISHNYLKKVLISEVIKKKPASAEEGKAQQAEDILKAPDVDNKPSQEKKQNRDLI
ncbi:MAG: contractile injection system tape measure protein, partial [Chitinophagaceae bacterium]